MPSQFTIKLHNHVSDSPKNLLQLIKLNLISFVVHRTSQKEIRKVLDLQTPILGTLRSQFAHSCCKNFTRATSTELKTRELEELWSNKVEIFDWNQTETYTKLKMNFLSKRENIPINRLLNVFDFDATHFFGSLISVPFEIKRRERDTFCLDERSKLSEAEWRIDGLFYSSLFLRHEASGELC